MTNAVHTTELSPSAIHATLSRAADAGWQATLTGPAGWRAPGQLATPDRSGRLPFVNPWGMLSALPVGSSVRVDLQSETGCVSFYTQTRGTDGHGRWLLEVPTVIQTTEHRGDVRLEVAPGALSLAHADHGALEVIDLSQRGLSFRATSQVAAALEQGGDMTAVLHVPGGEPIPMRLELCQVRRAPGQPLMRIVGTRFVSNGRAVLIWYADRDGACAA